MGEKAMAANRDDEAASIGMPDVTENAAIFGSAVSPEESHGAMPVMVLAAGNADVSAPGGIRNGMQAARTATHDAIIVSSCQGRMQHIPDSSHDMQLDQPQAIANAVAALLPWTPVPNAK